MHGLTVRIVEVDCCALVVMTLDLPQMHSQIITELTELSFTRVLQAELKSCKNEQYKLRMRINGDFTVVLNGIQICQSVRLENLHLQSKSTSNKMQSNCHA